MPNGPIPPPVELVYIYSLELKYQIWESSDTNPKIFKDVNEG